MRNATAFVFAALGATILALSGCGTTQDTVIQDTQVRPVGALSVRVVPNPIVARRTSGEMWTFPFDVVVQETGGSSVQVQRVTIRVTAFGSIPVYSDTQDAAEIRTRGYPTEVPANGELRYRFSPTREVPDERLFGGVQAELVVDAVNDRGQAIPPARTTVSVTR
ncbi:MAG TPA: hypothetical protein VMS12_05325 [Thermoanaerobaculia bacterium]|nr:hypothetical protein [Thermoanaerobaculia bacterium]